MITYKSSQKYFNPRTGEYYVVITLTGEIQAPNDDTIITDTPPQGDIVIVYSEDIQNAISKLIDGAPDGLNTLGKLVTELNRKEYHIDGKMLSENDFTDYYKQKIESVDFNSNRYIHPLHHTFDELLETEEKKIFTQAERAKLAAIQQNANNYNHPEIHSASIIVETDKRKWFTPEERTKLEILNNYVHPNTHNADIINESISKNFVSLMEKERWNKKAELADIDSRINQTLSINPDTVSLINDIVISESSQLDIITKLSNKVDKVFGYSLSENNFSNIDKEKLMSVDFGANYYKHPQYHTISEIKDLDYAISTNHIVRETNELAHNMRHGIDSLLNHEGISNVSENEIVIFNQDGLFKSSGKFIPNSDIVGILDYQNVLNKNIDNTVIGKTIPREASFLDIDYTINSIEYSDKNLNITQNMNSHIIYIEKNIDETLLHFDSPSTLLVTFSDTLLVGSFFKLYFIDNLNVIINPGQSFRVRGFPNNTSITKQVSSGDFFLIHKDSVLGFTIFDKGWTIHEV